MQLVVVSINSIPFLRNRDTSTFNEEELKQAALVYYKSVKSLLLRTFRQVALAKGHEFTLRDLPDEATHVIVQDDGSITVEVGITHQFNLAFMQDIRQYLRVNEEAFKRKLTLDEHKE